MKYFFYRTKNAIKIFIWAFKNSQTLQLSTFKMLSDMLVLIMKVAEEKKHMMTKVCVIHPETGEEHEIVSIWAGAGIGASPTKRIEELLNENRILKQKLARALTTPTVK